MSKAFDILSGALNEAIADTKTKRLSRRTQSVKGKPTQSSTSWNVESIQQKTALITKPPFSNPS